jgi:hypothetical protein
MRGGRIFLAGSQQNIVLSLRVLQHYTVTQIVTSSYFRHTMETEVSMPDISKDQNSFLP